MIHKDIEGREIELGDELYFAVKLGYSQGGILRKAVVKSITDNSVNMAGGYRIKRSYEQALIARKNYKIG